MEAVIRWAPELYHYVALMFDCDWNVGIHDLQNQG
jgi:hypothetical protein